MKDMYLYREEHFLELEVLLIDLTDENLHLDLWSSYDAIMHL